MIKYLNKKPNLFLTIFIVLIISFVYFFNKDRRDHLKGNVNYTFGTIISLGHGAKTPNSYKYGFYVNNKLQESSWAITSDLALRDDSIQEKNIGKMFLVKYSVEKPKYSELYLDKLLPDSLLKCFKCVWNEPPF